MYDGVLWLYKMRTFWEILLDGDDGGDDGNDDDDDGDDDDDNDDDDVDDDDDDDVASHTDMKSMAMMLMVIKTMKLPGGDSCRMRQAVCRRTPVPWVESLCSCKKVNLPFFSNFLSFLLQQKGKFASFFADFFGSESFPFLDALCSSFFGSF